MSEGDNESIFNEIMGEGKDVFIIDDDEFAHFMENSVGTTNKENKEEEILGELPVFKDSELPSIQPFYYSDISRVQILTPLKLEDIVPKHTAMERTLRTLDYLKGDVKIIPKEKEEVSIKVEKKEEEEPPKRITIEQSIDEEETESEKENSDSKVPSSGLSIFKWKKKTVPIKSEPSSEKVISIKENKTMDTLTESSVKDKGEEKKEEEKKNKKNKKKKVKSISATEDDVLNPNYDIRITNLECQVSMIKYLMRKHLGIDPSELVSSEIMKKKEDSLIPNLKRKRGAPTRINEEHVCRRGSKPTISEQGDIVLFEFKRTCKNICEGDIYSIRNTSEIKDQKCTNGQREKMYQYFVSKGK